MDRVDESGRSGRRGAVLRGLGSPFSASWWFTLSVGLGRDIRFYYRSRFMLMGAYEEGG